MSSHPNYGKSDRHCKDKDRDGHTVVQINSLSDKTKQENDQEQRQHITAGNNTISLNVTNPSPSAGDNLQTVTFEVTRRFNQFLQTISNLKNQGRNPDTVLFNRYLNELTGFIDPDFVSFKFYTVGIVIDFPTVAAIRGGYTFYANVIFNAWSQHYNYNPVVYIEDPNAVVARLRTDGGENASIFADGVPTEQITLTDWDIVWRKKNDIWYIYDYAEFGRRIFRMLPPSGPWALIFQYLYPGAVPEIPPTLPEALTAPEKKIRAGLAQYIKSP